MPRKRQAVFYPALLVIDMQNGFCSSGGSYEEYGGHIGADLDAYMQIVPNVVRVIAACRELQIPVFYSQQVREASGIDLFTRLHLIIPKRRAEFLRIPACVSGTWDAAILDELRPAEGDHIVVKRRDSAFQDTELDLWLRSSYVDTIICTGVDTAICVENTLTDGFNMGYDVILVEDATASSWEEIGRATLMKVRGSYGWVLKADQLIELLHTNKCGEGAFSFPPSLTNPPIIA
ncbi:cysteine hydrolase family protein [Chloroflexota bacterium]